MSTSTSLEFFPSETKTAQILTVVQLIYGIPSFGLLVFFFVFLQFKSVFRRSFYRLIQLDLFVNILCHLNSWIAVRLFTFPLGISILKIIESSVPGVLTFSRFLAFWFQHMQFCCTAALSLNRLTSIVDSENRFEKIWSRWYPLYATVSCIYSTLPTIPSGIFLLRISMVEGVLTMSMNPEKTALALNIVAIFAVLYLIVLLVLGPITSYKASKQFKLVGNNTSSGLKMKKEVSKRLTNISLSYCAVYTGNIIWSVLFAADTRFQFLPNAIRDLQSTSLAFVSDSLVLSLPYILLIFDTNVKRELMKTWRKSGVTSVVHVTNSNGGIAN